MRMTEVRSLFSYAEAYPGDREELIDKLPDLCRAARLLTQRLVDRGAVHPDAYAVAVQRKSHTVKRKWSTDPQGIAERRAAAAETVIEELVCFPLEDGMNFSSSLSDYDFAKNYFEVTSHDYEPYENWPYQEGTKAKTDGRNKKWVRLYSCFALGHETYEFMTRGSEKSTITDMRHSVFNYRLIIDPPNGVLEEEHAVPISRLTPQEAAVHKDFGVHGLAYHQALGHLLMMRGLAGDGAR